MKTFRPLAALRHRNYRLFWTGQLISLIGTWMHQTAQGWLVFKLTDSPFFLGLAGMVASAPILLFTLAGGVLADRHPKKNIILLSNIVIMFLALTLAILVAAGAVNVWHVLVLSFLIGSVNAFEIPARQSFIIELVGKEDLLNGIALNSSAFNVARMIGPAIAGLIMGAFGLAPCFFINALSFIAIVIALVKMRFKPEESKTTSKPGMTSSLKEGIKYIFHNSDISALLIAAGIVSFFGFPYISFLPVYARDILKTGATGLGILMGCAGAGAFTGAVGLAIKGDTARKGIVMAVAGIIFSTALLIFSFSTSVWLSYTMLFLVGFGAINQIATANSLLQLNVPNELRGRVMSSFTTMFLGMTPLGNFAVGSLAHYVGTQNALMTSAGFCLAGTAIVLWKKPEILKM
jgi:MFS family permease